MADYSKYRWKTKMGEVKYGGKVAGVTLDTSLLDQMIAEMPEKVSLIVNDVGTVITKKVSDNAPVDKGELRDSYLAESGMTDKLTFTIRDGTTLPNSVAHGIFVELGTSKMAAQPHVVPAMEDAEAELIKAFTELFA